MKRYAYIPLVTVMASCAIWKGGNKKSGKAAVTAATPAETTGKNGIKPYSKVVTNEMITRPGLFTVHSTKELDTILFEVGKPLLNKDILVVNRILKIVGNVRMHAGEELSNKTIFFERGPNETILIRLDPVIADADSTDAIYRAVKQSTLPPVVGIFPIKAYGKDSASYVIDVTSFLKQPDNFLNDAEGAEINKRLNVSTMRDHAVESIRAYPSNVEISISKNGTTLPLPTKEGQPATLETNSSFIALPEVPMQRRYFDERVGFFTDYVYLYGDAQQKIKLQQFIQRWRMEPKPEDLERYKRGELVEPAKPILIYIDPATPKQWRKYLIMGVNDWQAAFEQAGFKNAISAKEWPENDTSMHMEDVRYSFLNYFASPIANAYGPNTHDPRSGEIIQTHIGWYHNVMSLVYNWYLIQAAANDPKARFAKLDEELMGQLIRFVSSHEIGHTLGLRHNFGSSSQTPVDSLRSIAFLRKYGHTASIMDYARFNYVAQPEDNIPQELLFPRIGDYDKWAIEWGYKFIGAKTPEEDRKIQAPLTTARLAANNRLWFGDGESRIGDPRCQSEDLGDDNMKANTLGLKNIKRLMEHLPEWTYEEGGQYETMKGVYGEIEFTYLRMLSHVASNLTGVYYTIGSDGDTTASYVPVPKEKQIAATEFINRELFNTPFWMLNPRVYNIINNPATRDAMADIQIKAVQVMLSQGRLSSLLHNERRFGKDKVMGVEEFFPLMRKGIWSDLTNGTVKIDGYHRDMQRTYIGSLFTLTREANPDSNDTECVSAASAEIKEVAALINKALPRATDALTKAHLTDLQQRIKRLSEIK